MDKLIRKQLADYLKGKHAHMSLEDAVKGFPVNQINSKAPNSDYTPYRLLEHIRRTQGDIVEFIKNPKYKYLKWPEDYWPKDNFKATKKDWDKSLKMYKKDYKELIAITQNPKLDLMRKIPHGTGQSIFKEIIVIIDHNSYHIGEFGILRDVMKTWGKTKSPV